MTSSNRGASRRDALKLAGAAGLAGVVAVYPSRRSFASADQELTLDIEAGRVVIDGVSSKAYMMGGSVPAPTLRWREGQEVVVHAVNRSGVPSSIHWHGLLIVGNMDGAPGFNSFQAIQPGETHTFRFKLRQAGTYWYHSHSVLQEQAGMYGAIIIEPTTREPFKYDRDYVVVLSDHTQEDPRTVLGNLKSMDGYYNYGRRTLVDLFKEARRDGLGAALRDRADWGQMRMDPTDLADVTGYAFLVNGKGPRDNWTGLFAPGERVRLRFINASAMTIFDVHLPDLPMTVVAADGPPVQAVKVDEFRFGVGETYDVIVLPSEDRAYTIMAEPIDRSGYARGTLAPREGMEAAVPPPRPRAMLIMADMGMAHGGMDHSAMGGSMAGMDGSAMAGMDHSAMGGSMAGMDHSAMAGMDHSAMSGSMAGMDHSSMAGSAARGGALGWADAGTAPGKKALAYEDLRAFARNPDAGEPTREIVVRLTGNMERYIWTLNGEKFDVGNPIRVKHGERVRIKYINETMMAHPMHLHGMFVELENGQTDRMPLKHVTLVKPGRELSVVLTANEVGDWPFHCHLLYHMASGMMTRFIVEPPSQNASL